MSDLLQRLLCHSVFFSLPLLIAHLWEVRVGKKYLATSRKRLWIIMFSCLLLAFLPIPEAIQIKLPQSNVGQIDLPLLRPLVQWNIASPDTLIPHNSTNIINIEASGQFVFPALTTILIWVWGIGALLTACIFLAKHIRFMRFVLRWSIPEQNSEILNLFNKRKSELQLHGFNRNVTLHRNWGVSSPLIYGFIRPRILLPDTAYSLEALDSVICHELAHCKACDLWIGILQTLSKIIYWFYPLVWKASNWMDEAMECACDELATKNQGKLWRKHYAITLVQSLPRKSENNPGFSKGFSNKIEERIELVMNNSIREKGGIAVISVFASIVLCCTFVFSAPTVKAVEPDNVQAEDTSDYPEDTEYTHGESEASKSSGAEASEEHQIERVVFPVSETSLSVTTSEERSVILETKSSKEVYAIKDGVVVYSGYKGSLGHVILIKHEDGFVSKYAHFNTEKTIGIVSTGQNVNAGDLIGYTGASGRAEAGKSLVTIVIYKDDDGVYDFYSALSVDDMKLYLERWWD